MDPLHGLDDVAWQKLEHAYGKAKDTPGHLRALATGDAKARKKAMFRLHASLCHQGTSYSATVAAVPFVYRLLARRAQRGRDRLLAFLSDILTQDDPGTLLLNGLREPQRWGRDPFSRSFVAVRDGAPAVLPLLSAKKPATRARAAFLFACLEKHAKLAGPALAARLAVEEHPMVRATLLLSLGFVAQYLDSPAWNELFRAQQDQPLPAALALSTATSGEIDADTRRVIAEGAKTEALVPGFGDLGRFCTQVLSALEANDELVDVVGSPSPSAGLAANVLVRALFECQDEEPELPRPPEPFRLDDLDALALRASTVQPSKLTPTQRRFLEACAASEDAWDGDLASGMQRAGLPGSQPLLRRFLGAPTEPKGIDRVIQIGGRSTTPSEVLLDWARSHDDEPLRALVKSVGPIETVHLAVAQMVEIEHDDARGLGARMLRMVPEAEDEMRRLAEQYQRDGAPERASPNGSRVEYRGILCVLGAGIAEAGLSRGREADAFVEGLLKTTYGFVPAVRDALRALPVARREAWLLDPERDDQEQPTEYFLGAWPYWVACPSAAITARVLAHARTWKKKDPERKKHADRWLRAYVEALDRAGMDAHACREALARLA